jgi:hypothetical protein
MTDEQINLVQQLRDTAKMGVSDDDCLMLDAADWIKKLEYALERIRDCDWPGPASFMGSRADWMQKLAREALR